MSKYVRQRGCKTLQNGEIVMNYHCCRRAKKEDLRRIASELELSVSDKLTVLDFMDLIKNCDRYKNDPDSVHELANLTFEERKSEESQQLELEKKI
ncbi:hypothetical protein TNCV_2973421 [Trichonephila clavipes]|nr:hypothetical protein TNCV_2973421 [Trichonephila clavipes]